MTVILPSFSVTLRLVDVPFTSIGTMPGPLPLAKNLTDGLPLETRAAHAISAELMVAMKMLENRTLRGVIAFTSNGTNVDRRIFSVRGDEAVTKQPACLPRAPSPHANFSCPSSRCC